MMSETLASLRRKMDGAQKLEVVVRTMKAMAASSIGQYEAAVRALADYQRCVELGLSACLRADAPIGVEQPPRRGAASVGAIVFGSDQGLVGRFNETIADFAVQTLNAIPATKTVWAVGERLCQLLVDAGLSLAGRFTVPISVAAITPLVGQIQIESEARRSDGEYAQLYVFHNSFKSAARYEPVSQRLLPLDAQWRDRLARLPWPTAKLPETLSAHEATLTALMREYLFISLYQACADSLASENGSRLAAMQRAEKNIEARSAELRQTFYRLRQNSIDEELFDVISGFNALSTKTRLPRHESHE
jgi:F-type H+-transporting ATPase subunit gamma